MDYHVMTIDEQGGRYSGICKIRNNLPSLQEKLNARVEVYEVKASALPV
jgi:hypothetical protein